MAVVVVVQVRLVRWLQEAQVVPQVQMVIIMLLVQQVEMVLEVLLLQHQVAVVVRRDIWVWAVGVVVSAVAG
jgi:hypothetical protein